ncbi:MAG: cation transporter [Gammaproteobacteria bacterium]|nr:MAG: cation transporter [Gammaproteobacteria bacterium]RKZ72281.1 MAG: cation transporter [Gammaproteobacteria bacterium]
MNSKNKHAISLGLFLFILWLLLSGHYTSLLISFGLFSVTLVVVLALRMDVVDHEGQPLHLDPIALLIYWCWLLKEIFVSNIYVCRLIVSPTMPISPTVIALRSSQASDLARVIFANSITLTPGTVTIDVDGDITEVHAITEEAASSLIQGSMDTRVTALENRSEK